MTTTLGSIVKAERAERELTQEAAAEAMELSAYTVVMLEQDNGRRFHTSTLKRVAAFTNRTLDEIISLPTALPAQQNGTHGRSSVRDHTDSPAVLIGVHAAETHEAGGNRPEQTPSSES